MKKLILIWTLFLQGGCDETGLFISEYIKNSKSIGAVAPSSKSLSEAMVEPILEEDSYILELGAGTGAFTNELIHKTQLSKLFIIENNEVFYNILRNKFPQNHILLADATELEKHIPQEVQGKIKYVISGLPFRSLPDDVSSKILKSLKKVCASDVTLVQFTYLNDPPIPNEIFTLFQVTPQFYKSVPDNLPAADVWIYKTKK